MIISPKVPITIFSAILVLHVESLYMSWCQHLISARTGLTVMCGSFWSCSEYLTASFMTGGELFYTIIISSACVLGIFNVCWLYNYILAGQFLHSCYSNILLQIELLNWQYSSILYVYKTIYFEAEIWFTIIRPLHRALLCLVLDTDPASIQLCHLVSLCVIIISAYPKQAPLHPTQIHLSGWNARYPPEPSTTNQDWRTIKLHL